MKSAKFSLQSGLVVLSLAASACTFVPANISNNSQLSHCLGSPADFGFGFYEPLDDPDGEVYNTGPGDDVVIITGSPVTVNLGEGNNTVCVVDVGLLYADQVTIVGGSGDDTIVVDASITETVNVMAGGGTDYVSGGSGDDEIDLGFGSDDYGQGMAGDDTIFASGAEAYLEGGVGDDSLFAGDGFSPYLYGGPGQDELTVGDADDAYLDGGIGGDGLTSGDGDGAYLDGGFGNDALTVADATNAYLDGGEGDDDLLSGSGDDDLEGGSHINGDNCRGGLGANLVMSCEFSTPTASNIELASDDWQPVVDELTTWMNDRDISAGSLHVAVEGTTVVTAPIGWRDEAETIPLVATDRFRIASVTKPFTKAAILQQVDFGNLALSDRAFCTPALPNDCLLSLAPGPGRTVNPAIATITVDHLLEHRGGWDRDLAGDPMFDALNIAAFMSLPGGTLADETDVARYMISEPLQHVPGTEYRYSNFGYLVLGLILESVVGTDYLGSIQGGILGPIGDASTIVGRSLPGDRAADEVYYACNTGMATNVFDQFGPNVCWPDGGFHIEAMDAHGALVTNTPALAEFLSDYCIDGTKRTAPADGCGDAQFFGSLPGTWSFVRQVNTDRIDLAALFNQRAESGATNYFDVDNVVLDAVEAVMATSPLRMREVANPTPCDGNSNTYGFIVEATPGAVVSFASEPPRRISSGVADASGEVELTWTCNSGTNFSSRFSAIDEVSGKTTSFTLVGESIGI